jgi:hypothetical protein
MVEKLISVVAPIGVPGAMEGPAATTDPVSERPGGARVSFKLKD